MRFLIFLFFAVSCFSSDQFETKKKAYYRIDPPKWQIKWHLARTLIYANRTDEAILEYESLIKARPRNYDAKIELANIFLSRNDLRNALKIAKKIPIRHLDEPSKVLLSMIYFQNCKVSHAEKILRKYLVKHPRDYSVRSKLASLYVISKNYDKALAEYKFILYTDPSNSEAKRNYLLINTLKGR